MSNKKAMVIDFYGIEKYEIIIYLAALMNYVGKKILIVDLSENKALSHCIPLPNEFDFMNFKFNFYNVDFGINSPSEDDLSIYDYIFIDYGFRELKKAEIDADKHIIVTDKQLHNINRLQFKDKDRDTYLIFKNIGFNDKTELLTSLYTENLNVIRSYYLIKDDLDSKYMEMLQYEKFIHGTTKQMKNLLQDCMLKLFNISKKEFKSAFKKLKKGNL